MSDDIEYRALQEADCDDFNDVVIDAFKNEPMVIASGLEEEEMAEDPYWEVAQAEFLSGNGLSIGAFDKRNTKLVGIGCSLIQRRDDRYQTKEDMRYDIDNPGTRKFAQLEWFFKTLHEGINLFDMYGVDEDLRFYGLWVKQAYTRRRIASRLVQEAIKAAKETGFKCIFTEASSNFSRKIFERSGFETLKTIEYTDFDIKGEKVFIIDTSPHICATLHVLAL